MIAEAWFAARHLVWRGLLLVLLALLSGCSRPPTAQMRFAPAGMNPTGKYTTSTSGAVTFWGNGALRLRLFMEEGPLMVTLRAGGNVADGDGPRVVVSIDGQVVDTLSIDSTQHREYAVSIRLADTGTKLLEIAFANYVAKPNPLDGRTLYIESVSVRSGT
jgi:hypothetical protein